MFGLSSLATTAIGAAVIAAMAFAGGMRVEYKIESGKIAALQLEYAQAEIKARDEAAAQQKQFDTISITQAQSENAAQTALTSRGNLAINEVPSHVVTKVIAYNCVPMDFIRLLDAAASGRSTTDLPLPAGKSTNSCAASDWTSVARSVVANYYTSRANSQQLDHLIATYRQMQAARR